MNEKIIKLAQRSAFFGVPENVVKKIFNPYIQAMTISEIIDFGKEIGKYAALHQMTVNLIVITKEELDYQYVLSVIGKEATSRLDIHESDIEFIKEKYAEKHFFYK